MTSNDSQDAAEIERRVRVAATQADPDYWPLIGDLMTLFGADRPSADIRSTIHNWLRKGVKFGDRRIVIRYRLSPGGYRMAHPADVALILDETRKIRSSDAPDGIPDPQPGTCPTCGQSLPVE